MGKLSRAFLTCLFLLALLCSSAQVFSAGQTHHLRVVLDISKSLSINRPDKGWPTDPGRLAILSTILFYDLASPNPTLGDSFEVIPFDSDWKKWEEGDAPPVSMRPVIQVFAGMQRDDFVNAMYQLEYDGDMTYFYPGLLRAVNDLTSLPQKEHENKTLLLITDGLPEQGTREAEVKKIREELVPLMEQHDIRLYILAFGEEAYKAQGFFDAMTVASDGFSRLGEFIVDPNGGNLLYSMIKIFSYNFGYVPDTPQKLLGHIQLDLDGGFTPQQVAVIVQSNKPKPEQPKLSLTPPQNAKLNIPDGIQSANEKGGSYSLSWVLSPDKGLYQLATDVSQGSVALLRPGNVELEVRPAPPHSKRTDLALAGKSLPLKILVKPPSGAKGDPGEVDLSFMPYTRNANEPLAKHKLAPPPGSGILTAEGREYDMLIEFPPLPKTPKQDYEAYIEIEAYRGKALVASLRHSVDVKASGIFHYEGGPVSVNLGQLHVRNNPVSCGKLKFKTPPQQFGEVEFTLEKRKLLLPFYHSLSVRVGGTSTLELGGNAVTVRENEEFEVCLTVEEYANSSVSDNEIWLALKVKDTDEPAKTIPIQLTWQVTGLSFWEKWGWLILTILAVLALLFIIAGIVTPQRFSGSLALVFVPERDELDDQSPFPVKQWKGVGAGFFRNARAYLQPDFRLSGRSQGALAALIAEKGGCRVVAKNSGLFRETIDGEWEPVPQDGRRARPGDVYRIGDKGPFFRVAAKGRG